MAELCELLAPAGKKLHKTQCIINDTTIFEKDELAEVYSVAIPNRHVPDKAEQTLLEDEKSFWRRHCCYVQPPYYATPRPTTSHSALKLVDQRRAASRHILPQVATIRQDQAVNKRRESLLWTLATDRNVAVMATSRLAIAVQFPSKAQQCQFQRTAAKLKSIESICNNAFLTTQRNNSSISCLSQVEDNKVSTNPLSTLVHGVLLVFTTMHPILPPAIRL